MTTFPFLADDSCFAFSSANLLFLPAKCLDVAVAVELQQQFHDSGAILHHWIGAYISHQIRTIAQGSEDIMLNGGNEVLMR